MIYVVGPFAIDTDAYEVRRNGAPSPIEPQVFDLLVFLIENRSRFVTRAEIIETVWKGRIVSDAAISSRIKSVRKALGDDGKAQSVIRTIHGRGFQFVGDVIAGPRMPDNAGSQSTAAEALSHEVDRDSAVDDLENPDPETVLTLPNRPSIVVLPFHTLSNDEWRVVGDGLSHDIVTQLGRSRWLFVISRGTSFLFRGAELDITKVAAKLGVRYVLQGIVQILGNRIRVNASLSDGISGREVWAEHYDRTLEDIFAVQDEIAGQIVGTVESEIEQSERTRAVLVNPASLDAWSAFHRGCWHMFKFRVEHYEEAERYFKLAAKLDPSSPRAFSGLSFVHWQRAFLEISDDRQGEIAQALELAQHSVALDPRDPQAHWALGRAYLLRKEMGLAVEELETAVDLNPNFAIGQYSLGFAQTVTCDHRAGAMALKAARRLSPFDVMSFAMMASQAFIASLDGRLDEGADLAVRAARQPNAHYHIVAIAALCNGRAGRDAVAQTYLKRLLGEHPGYCIGDYFRAFPYTDPAVIALVAGEFSRIGLPA